VNTVDDGAADSLGFVVHVYEQVLGEDKYTFVEDVKNPHTCTILVKGSTVYVLFQINVARYDDLRAAKNVLDDGAVLPGVGAFEGAANLYLTEEAKKTKGKNTAGIQCFADSLLVIPQLIAQNSGLDALQMVVKLQ
jgi:T-complex protein 1 subunit zeta